jgi:hypothetical protein
MIIRVIVVVYFLAVGFTLGLALGIAHAQSGFRCPGFEPAPPVGCKGPARCQCDEAGRCGWWFDCDGYGEGKGDRRR